MSLRVLSWLTCLVLGCGGAAGNASTPPAATGVRAYVATLESGDPRAAYALLSSDAKAMMPYEEFVMQWRQSAAERRMQAQALRESLKGDPALGERARVAYRDGRSAQLVREANAWRLEAPLVTRAQASRPRDAIEIFLAALTARDVDAVLQILTERRAAGIRDQLERFLTSLAANQGADIDIIGGERAELRWEAGGLQYKIVVRKEGQAWRIDDVHMQPVPASEATSAEEPIDSGD